MSTLVIESGGTKASWYHINNGKIIQHFETTGLHPLELRYNEHKLNAFQIAITSISAIPATKVYFYGAGCENTTGKEIIKTLFASFQLNDVSIHSDLYGACLACLGNQTGHVGILGTGAVVAYFNGQKIEQQTSGLGYVLGDEGSGFYIGKLILKAYFNKQLPQNIEEIIVTHFDKKELIIPTVYSPEGRRKTASICEVIYPFKDNPIIQNILSRAFEDFVLHAIRPMRQPVSSIQFVGSVAHYFKKELNSVLNKYAISITNIIPSAGKALAVYHAES